MAKSPAEEYDKFRGSLVLHFFAITQQSSCKYNQGLKNLTKLTGLNYWIVNISRPVENLIITICFALSFWIPQEKTLSFFILSHSRLILKEEKRQRFPDLS